MIRTRSYRWLRDNDPCYRNDTVGFYALSRYADVLEASQQPLALQLGRGHDDRDARHPGDAPHDDLHGSARPRRAAQAREPGVHAARDQRSRAVRAHDCDRMPGAARRERRRRLRGGVLGDPAHERDHGAARSAGRRPQRPPALDGRDARPSRRAAVRPRSRDRGDGQDRRVLAGTARRQARAPRRRLRLQVVRSRDHRRRRRGEAAHRSRGDRLRVADRLRGDRDPHEAARQRGGALPPQSR